MHRIGIVLALAAAPLMAQQSSIRPDPVVAAEARVEAQRVAQEARVESLREAQAARAGQMTELRAAQLDMTQAARAMAFAAPSVNVNVRPAIADFGAGFGSGIGQGFASTYALDYNYSYGPKAPSPWAPQDPADSLYRQAQQAMNRGDYRRAAALFKDLPVKQPNSVYASDALYWEAFSLYRIGGTTELQEALAVLDQRKSKYPAGRSRGDADPALATRIAGVLSVRGLGEKDLVKRALTEGNGACDNEDQSVRSEALNALRQTDPDEALTQAKKILGRKDDCSVQLRRSALWMIANKKDAAATATLVGVAKNDPSTELRSEATGFLGSMGGDEALAALEELLKSDQEQIQRAAVRALTTFPSPRARTAMRSLIENNGANEQLRIAAIDAFNSDRSTLEDASWLRSIYAKVESARVKSRIVSAVSRIGGEQNEQWLLTLARNEDESVEARQYALRYVVRTVDIATLTKYYDGLSARPLREEIVNALGERKEPEATDKLIEIVRSGTDPQVRRTAINQLSRKKDARSEKLFMDLLSGDSPAKKP
ncbi:MAG: HEAT repeat domain-containing protein [Gemmatimonadales bacterium]